MPAQYSNILLKTTHVSLSPVIDNSGFDVVYFASSGTPVFADVLDLVSWFMTKFTTIPTGAGKAPSTWVSKTFSRNALASSVAAYDISNHLNGTPHGSPVTTGTMTLTSPGPVNPIPEGVCCTITLQAPYGSDVEFAPGARPRARDRGRIYFGPLNTDSIANEGTTNRCIVAPGLQIDLTQWIKGINSHTTSGGLPYQLGVWSRKNALVKALSSVSVDDRPDYQRRRADQGASKLTVSLP